MHPGWLIFGLSGYALALLFALLALASWMRHDKPDYVIETSKAQGVLPVADRPQSHPKSSQDSSNASTAKPPEQKADTTPIPPEQGAEDKVIPLNEVVANNAKWREKLSQTQGNVVQQRRLSAAWEQDTRSKFLHKQVTATGWVQQVSEGNPPNLLWWVNANAAMARGLKPQAPPRYMINIVVNNLDRAPGFKQQRPKYYFTCFTNDEELAASLKPNTRITIQGMLVFDDENSDELKPTSFSVLLKRVGK